MTKLKIGVVDVFLLRGAAHDLRVLLLRRAEGTRCTGAWEVVHGNVRPRERPQTAALREVREETGLSVTRLYNVICQQFYLHQRNEVQVAVVFAAFTQTPDAVALGPEHDAAEWLRPEEAMQRMSWPRSASALRDALQLLGPGHAGPVEDVLRVL